MDSYARDMHLGRNVFEKKHKIYSTSGLVKKSLGFKFQFFFLFFFAINDLTHINITLVEK